MGKASGIVLVCFVSGVSVAEQYPVGCTYSPGELRLMVELGDLAEKAEVVYTPEKKLVVRAGDEAESLTFTVEQCTAYLVLKSKHVHRQGVPGDPVAFYDSRSSTTTYSHILPFCVADTGALYTKEQGRITLILLPANKASS